MRPLPQPVKAPLAAGPKLFVDAAKGSDANAGSQAAPWKSLAHATRQLKPGDTLYLRGGTFYEKVALTRSGTTNALITIASFPGELAVIDGGLREFAGADLGPLDVHHDRDLALEPLGNRAHPADGGADPVVARVGHVEADDIHAAADQLLQHRLALGRGTEGDDDLGVAERAGRHGGRLSTGYSRSHAESSADLGVEVTSADLDPD